MLKLELQLDNYIDAIKDEDSFKCLTNLVELSVKLVKTWRHNIYDMVLILPVAIVSVERVFSALTFVKTKLRNKMGDSFLDDCLHTFSERDVFFQVNEDDIVNTFMNFRKRRPDKKK